MTSKQRERVASVVKQAATGVFYLRNGTAVYGSDDLVPAIAALLTAHDALQARVAELRALVDEQAIENGEMAAKGDALICAHRASEADRDEWKSHAMRLAADEVARRDAQHALQAQLAEAQKVHQSISETLIRESELTNSWMQRALEAERERDEERADYKRIVGELSDMAGQLEAACQERDAVRAENMALAARVEALLTTIDVERTAKEEARAEVERLGSTLTGATQHSQDVTRQWMDERVRAIAAERGATHWQAEHRRVVEALKHARKQAADLVEFSESLGLSGHADMARKDVALYDAALTPAPTGDGPQTPAPCVVCSDRGDVVHGLACAFCGTTPASGEGEGRS